MRVRYSTAATPDVAKAIGKVVSIATAKPRATDGRKARVAVRPYRVRRFFGRSAVVSRFAFATEGRDPPLLE